MKFPYGISDFEAIRLENYFYVDRTDRLPLLEESGKTLLFLRPRRFGKTLLLSMLENYYDVAKAEQFEALFGSLAIGQKPTAKHHQYLILRWNFSMVASQGDVPEIRKALHDHLNSGIIAFAKQYQHVVSDPIEIMPDNAIFSFESALTAARRTPYKVYLLIDEYDNFANEVFMAGQAASTARYQALIEGEGMLKTLFKAIKAGAEGRGLDRVFITGISPVVMSDLTSGFNIAQNIYLRPQFNDLCGFREHEILSVLRQIGEAKYLSGEQDAEVLNIMRTFYNGYSFAYDHAPDLYNPTLALYFLEQFDETGRYPRRMLDLNLAMDRSKIEYIAQLPYGEQVVAEALNDERPLAIAELSDRFGVQDMLTAVKDETFMVSLLSYFGVLTLTNQRTEVGKLIFKIPNLVVRKLYVERLHDQFLPDFTARRAAERAAEQVYQTGEIEPLCDLVEQNYFHVFDNRDYRWTNELTIKTIFLTLLFNDTFYIMDSETSLAREYADFTMIVRPDMRQFQLMDLLIEFKYVSLPDVNLSGKQVRALRREELQALRPVAQKFADAQNKLTGYRRTLETVYGERLRLHVYSVVAIGYERLVWQAF